MGYEIGSVAMMGKGDPHTYFLFYVQSGYLEHEWINAYFRDNFSQVASSLGRDGVIVVATRHGNFNAEFSELMCSGTLRTVDTRQEVIFDGGYPLLVVTLYPISVLAEKTEGAEANCVVLNLASIRDERELGALIDSIVVASMNDDGRLLLEKIRPLARRLEDSRWNQAAEHADILELKPNLMGVGLNLNALIDWYRTRRRRPRV